MRVVTCLVFTFVLAAGHITWAQPPRATRPQFRCEVPIFAGATSPDGATATMTVVSDGLACSIMNWGVPEENRNPATAGQITLAPQHGTAAFLGATVRYVADRDYVGRDAFAYRATALDRDGISRVINVRVQVEVRVAPFDRTPGLGRVAALTPQFPIRVGNEVPVPRKTKDVKALAPVDAELSRAQGVVVLDATIESDGKVSAARVIQSLPLLDAAAIDAVRQWEFTPTTVNGRAVPVIMTVAVNFPAPASAAIPGGASMRPAAAPDASDVQPIRLGPGMPAPQVLKRVTPSYTSEALRAGVQGSVMADVTVDPQGKVSDVQVVRSIPLLDDAAVAAARQWEFTPTVLNGRAVPVIVNLELTFTTRPSPATPPSTSSARPATSPVATPAPLERPSAVDPDIEAGFQSLQKRQFDDALKAFRVANDKRGQKCAVCYMGIARAYESMGAAKNVVESCDRALALESSDKSLIVQAHQLKAIALQDLGQGKDMKRLVEAEGELRAALALDPSANYLHFNLGIVLLRQGRDTDGVVELNEELALRPTSPQAERARKMIENPRRAREAFAPDFSVVTLEREFIDLAGLKGKVVLLDFWGTWCPPCVRAVPSLRAIQKRHRDDNFVLLSVSSDSDEAVVRRFTESNDMHWPQFWDRERKVQQAFDVRAFPTYVVIDADGVVRFRTAGGGPFEPDGLEKAIKAHLKAVAGRPSKGE
jgi:TonB family protein